MSTTETPQTPNDISFPVSNLDDSNLSLLHEYLSEEKLKEQTQTNDLATVTYLELLVNLSDQSLSSLGERLPSLIHLKLNASMIPTIRDLGTSLRNLRVIWLNRCGLKDLDGIHALPELRELYLAYNDIDDISALNALEHLQILDLEANRIDDVSQLLFLQDLEFLDTLTLADNDCVMEAGSEYVSQVREHLPKLKYLDDEPIEVLEAQEKQSEEQESSSLDSGARPGSAARKYTPPSSKLDKDEIEMLKNTIKYTRVDEDESLLVEPQVLVATDRFITSQERDHIMRSRPQSANPTMARRAPGSAFQISASSFQNRPQSARPKNKPARPLTSFGLRSSDGASSSQGGSNSSRGNARRSFSHRGGANNQVGDSSSELTYGSNQVFAGNIVKNLRSRKAKRLSQQAQTPPVAPADSTFDIYDFNGDMLEEVMAYKLEEARKQSLLDEQQKDVETRFMSNDFEQIDTSDIPLVHDDDYFPAAPQNAPESTVDEMESKERRRQRRREKRASSKSRSRSRSKSRSKVDAADGEPVPEKKSKSRSRSRSRRRRDSSADRTSSGDEGDKRRSKASKRPRPKYIQKSSSPSENIPPNHRSDVNPSAFSSSKEVDGISGSSSTMGRRRLSASGSTSQLRSIFEEKERMRKQLNERSHHI